MTKIERINSELQKALSEIIPKELKDPRITGLCSIVNVDTSNDLGVSKVHMSIIGKDRAATVDALNHSAGYMRNLLRPRLKIRTVPELRFFLDTSSEHSVRISRILNEL